MDHIIEKHEAYTLIRFSGSLASDLEEQVRSILVRLFEQSEKGVVVDLEKSDFVSSNVLGLFFSLAHFAGESEKKITFCNVSEDLNKLFIMTGIAKHLHQSHTEAEALAYLTGTE